MSRPTVEPGIRFKKKYDIDPSSGCWTWKTSDHRNNGYVIFYVGESGLDQTYAHRYAWMMRHGPIPNGKFVTHLCGNRRCVNADHLTLKTQRGPKIRTPESRFWEKVEMIPFHDCWEWMGSIRQDGYGQFNEVRTKPIGAHRYSYKLHFGKIPDGKIICHQCDNPSCVRPDHLFAGTPKDNTRDMIGKARDRMIGERSAQAILTALEVKAIRALNSFKTTELSKIFGVKPSTILAIRKNEIWTTLTNQEVTAQEYDSQADD